MPSPVLTREYPLLQEAQKQKAGAASNAREKADYRANELTRLRSSEPPGAASDALSGALTFRFVTPDGKTFSFSGTGTLTIEGGDPIPPVTVTKLTGIRNPETGLLVTTTTSGTRLILEGENLVSETILVTCGGERSSVLRQSAGMIEFVAPVVPANKPPILVLYWLVSNQWVNKGSLPLTVTSSPTPPIPPAPGSNPRVDSIEPSAARVTLTGAGFGTVTGRLLLDKRPMVVVSWTDSVISCLLGQEKEFSTPVVDIWRPSEGWHTQGWVKP